MKTTAFANIEIENHFSAYPNDIRQRLMAVRELIFSEASRSEEIGELEETLKWNQPAYLTTKTKSGSTIRIDWYKKDPGKVALFFHCQTDLVETFREIFPECFTYEKNRALIIEKGGKLQEKELRHCISMALTYHLNKKRKTR